MNIRQQDSQLMMLRSSPDWKQWMGLHFEFHVLLGFWLLDPTNVTKVIGKLF